MNSFSLCVSTYTNAICKTMLGECQGDQIDRQQMDIRKHSDDCISIVLSRHTRNFYTHCQSNIYHRITDSLTFSSLSLLPPPPTFQSYVDHSTCQLYSAYIFPFLPLLYVSKNDTLEILRKGFIKCKKFIFCRFEVMLQLQLYIRQ